MNKAHSNGYLWFICLVSALGGFFFGFDLIVISGTISLVKAQFGFLPWQEGFFVSSAVVGCIAGTALAGKLSDRYGRKKNLFLAALVLFISAMGCTFATDANTLIFFRLIGGFGVGIATLISPLYISEISPTNVRGRMITLFQFAITVGIMISLFSNAGIQSYSNSLIASGNTEGLIGWLFGSEAWRGMFLAEGIPGIVFVLMCLVIPESPRWLIANNREKEARVIIEKVAGKSEANSLVQDLKNVISEETGKFADLFKGGNKKALKIAVALSFFSEMSGITVVFFYGPTILEKAGLSLGDSLGGFAIIGIVNVIFTVIALWLMDIAGRKKLLLTGTIGVIIAHSLIGMLFLNGQDSGMLLVFLMCAFVAFFAFSMGPIKFVVMNEIFPTKVRGRAVAIATIMVWVCQAFLNQFFPMLREIIPVGAIFLFFAAILIPQIIFTLKVMPETKGMSLEEIELQWKAQDEETERKLQSEKA
ncbi:sugar porter family MFS transporter [Vibrio maerlii]|uniref:sugar porter family MFS transporter n=1 Tax=Vibrio maerlii TaxID=2231648 RepID=UPI000E3C16AC|nr:sugar porter family MFS transporter [Vibrio maerlii]